MDTYSQALSNYFNNVEPKTFEIIRDDGYSAKVPISVFFEDVNFSKVELQALDRCYGEVLDIGAGVGRHSIELQKRGIEVTAIDISEEAVKIMNQRGVKKTICKDVMELSATKYDTLLMLMNGIGMVGTPMKLNDFFNQVRILLKDGGQLIVDSIDVSKTNDLLHVNYRKKNIRNSNYPGQQILKINYNGENGDWFKWLHLTFKELSMHALKNNFLCELISMDEDGHYLAKIQAKKEL